MIFRTIILTSCLLVWPAFAEEVAGTRVAPLEVRNMSPVVQLYGIPRMLGGRVTIGLQNSFNIEVGNNFQSEDRAGTFGFFDGESYVSTYRLRNNLGDRFEWGVEVPYMSHNGGNLDGLVDEFHELFGLPDGNRSLAPRGRLDYHISSDGIVYADFQDSRRSLGDVTAFGGMQLLESPTSALALRGQIKFPTGEVDDLSGSGGTDVSLWAEYQRAVVMWDYGFHLTLGGGLTHLGEGDLIPHRQESWVGFGHLGLQLPLTQRLAFIAQMDAHTDILDTGNPLLAEGGVLGTLGGRVQMSERFWLDLGLIEDLESESASDVIFQVKLGAEF